jgi:RNA polymerase sigma factor (sigma-70 family)
MDVTTQTTAVGWSYSSTGPLSRERLGEILGGWQAVEVTLARGFPECRGLAREQLEDLYQDTALALLSRPYASETHLRNALRQGIKHRALNLHRNERRRGQILAEHAPSIHRHAEGQDAHRQPEQAALLNEDRQLVLGFLAELDPLEREIFECSAEGLRYRAIATRLSLPVNEARRTMRAVERKRSSYQARFGPRDTLVNERERAHGRLAVGPWALLAVYVKPLRSWLFGTGATAKAAAVAASVAVIAAGTVRAIHDVKPSPAPIRAPTLGPRGVAAHSDGPATRPTAGSARRGSRPSAFSFTAQRSWGSVQRLRASPSQAPIAVAGGSQRSVAGAGTEVQGVRAATSAQTEFGIESQAR